MNILLWIIFGAIVGYVADYLDQSVSLSWIERIATGIVGAVVGGTITRLLTTGTLSLTSSSNFDVLSLVVAIIGALITLFVWKKMVRGTTSTI